MLDINLFLVIFLIRSGGGMKRIALILIIVASLICVTNYAYAQSTNNGKTLCWINFGFGSNFNQHNIMGDIGGSFSCQWQKYIVTTRFYKTQGGIWGPPPSITEFAVLFGMAKKTKWWLASGAGGLAYVSGVDDDNHNISTIGFPIESQLFVTPLSFFGLGVCLFGDLNTRMINYGALFCLQLGQLR